jgi:hypothetical protein
MRWAGLVARMGGKRVVYMVLVERTDSIRPLGRPRLNLNIILNLTFMGPCIVNIFQYIIYIWKLLYMLWVEVPPKKSRAVSRYK